MLIRKYKKITFAVISILILVLIGVVYYSKEYIVKKELSSQFLDKAPQKIITLYFIKADKRIYLYDFSLAEIFVISGNAEVEMRTLNYEDGFQDTRATLDGDYLVKINDLTITLLNKEVFINTQKLKENSAVIERSGKITLGAFNSHNRMPVQEK